MKLSILIYHRVLAQPDPLLPELPDARRFSRQLQMLRRLFRVLPLSLAVRLLQQGRLPARCACLTFDDGYLDNLTVALPILQQHGLSATFFIASDFLDGSMMWNDALIAAVRLAAGPTLDLSGAGLGNEAVATVAQKRNTIARLLAAQKYQPHAQRAALALTLQPRGLGPMMLNPAQLKTLTGAGMEIGAHTASHPILQCLPDPVAHQEIAQSRDRLEQIIQRPVTLFAYPNGQPGRDFDQRHVQMVRELGFQAACTTRPACVHADDALHALPRYTPWQTQVVRYALELVRSRML